MERLLKDLKEAIRGWLRTPLVSATVLVTLGLGIGLNTAVFSFVDSLLFRPLPVSEPEQLASVFSTAGGGELSTHSYADYSDLRDRSTDVFSGLLGFSMMFADHQLENRSEIILGELVTGNYWQVLGLQAAAGRLFVPEDEESAFGEPLAVERSEDVSIDGSCFLDCFKTR